MTTVCRDTRCIESVCIPKTPTTSGCRCSKSANSSGTTTPEKKSALPIRSKFEFYCVNRSDDSSAFVVLFLDGARHIMLNQACLSAAERCSSQSCLQFLFHQQVQPESSYFGLRMLAWILFREHSAAGRREMTGRTLRRGRAAIGVSDCSDELYSSELAMCT